MRFARFVLVAQALFMLAFSLAYWLRPYEMANLNGMLLMESASISHMRVYYGGLQLGLALYLLWALRAPERMRGALVMLVCMMSALVLGRLLSLLLDGGELGGFDLAALVYRLLAALLAALAYWLLREPEEPEPVPIPPPTRRLEDTPPQPFRLGEGPRPFEADGDSADPARDAAERRGDAQP